MSEATADCSAVSWERSTSGKVLTFRLVSSPISDRFRTSEEEYTITR